MHYLLGTSNVIYFIKCKSTQNAQVFFKTPRFSTLLINRVGTTNFNKIPIKKL